MDRHESEARIAMVLVSLPLPPLPVLACRGEYCTDGVVNSHDLHAMMMATDAQRVAQGAVTAEQHENRRLRKCALLNKLRDDVRKLLMRADLDDDGTCDRCYGLVCEALRKYWAEYAHTCADVRVCDLDSVVRGDVVYEHMLRYVRAHLGAEPSAADAQSYRGLFKCFVRGAFLGE
jgi:hypothetical protein